MDNNDNNVEMFDSTEIKIENLQKVSDNYLDQKRQKTGGDSTTCDTEALYGGNEHHTKEKSLGQLTDTIEETSFEAADAKDTPILVEDEFIPIGKRGKVAWKFVLAAATTDDEINKEGLGSLTNAVIQVKKKN